jgi:membrane protein insertase Oxa1/YidC/SpoIIIJ
LRIQKLTVKLAEIDLSLEPFFVTTTDMLRLPLRQASRLPTSRRIALERSILPATVFITKRHSSTNVPLPEEATSHTPELINALLAANQHFVETFHGAGLPWWASIITATVCLRSALTLPIAVYQQRAVGRMLAVAPIVQSWGETLKNQLAREGKTKGWEYERYNMELQKQVCVCLFVPFQLRVLPY